MMNLKSLRLGRAMSLVTRTLPIALVRLGVLLAFWAAALVYLAVVGGISWLVGQAIPLVGFILFIVGIGGLGYLYRLAQRYVLYLIKAAQIAVMAQLLTDEGLSLGTNQLAWGKEQVQARFGEASAMFVVDELVSGVVNAFTGTVYRVTSWLPGNTLRGLVRMVNRIVRFALSYIDEAILARTFWLDQGSVWANARDGVVLYAMVWKPLLMNAIALMLLSYVPFVLVIIVIGAPVGLLLSAISTAVAGWGIIAIIVLAWLVKVAIGDTFAMAAMIAAYYDSIQGLQPDPAMSARLEQITDRFGELTRRARQEVSGTDEQLSDPSEIDMRSADWTQADPQLSGDSSEPDTHKLDAER